jgi:NTP pyrophosphatase (non-canonical NTP hydrolase)
MRRGIANVRVSIPLQSFSLARIRTRKQTIHHHTAGLHLLINHSNGIGKMTIKEAQETVDRWIKEYGVRYFSELTNMAVLTEEVGELARVMARKYGDQSFKAGEKDNLGEEMADILWVLLCLANQTGVDLTTELQKSIEKKTQRDSLRHIQNEKLKA